MDSKYFKWIFVGLVLLVFLGTSQACSIDLENISLGARVDGDYLETISAEDNDEIDIKISFRIDNISGDDCPSNITARAKIYRLDDGDWDLVRTTTSKNQTLEEDEFAFTWSNEFTINDSYNRYKIEGFILEGSNELETIEAFIDVQDNTCSGIELVIENFNIDEGREITKNFKIENNTNKNFEINNLKILFTNSLINSGSADYSDFVGKYSYQNARITLRAGSVSSDSTTSGTFSVSGYLGDTFCSETQIGKKTFSVTVKETGSDYYDTPSSSSECNDIRIATRNIEMNENEKKKEVFYLENNSNKRFEITTIDVIDSGLTIKPFYFEKYVFPGNIGDIILELETPNVFENKIFEQILRVTGKFSDGRSCSYSSIGENRFFVTVQDNSNTQAGFSECEGITINIPKNVEIENNGSINFTINNTTGKKATIYLESDLVLSLGMIAIPNNSTISDKINVNINKSSGQIIMRPIIEGCNVSPTIITIKNTATGSIEEVSMSNSIEDRNGTKVLKIKFSNPTNKVFTGVLRLNLEGQIIEDRIISIPSGDSYSEVILDSKENIRGSISFVSEGKEITNNIEEKPITPNLAGLFTLGIIPSIIGWILLIIVVIIIVSVLLSSEERKKENWEEEESNKKE